VLSCHLDVRGIKSRRAKLSWSQVELADHADVSVGTISTLEQGGQVKMGLHTFLQITEALKIPLEEVHKLIIICSS